MLLASSAIIVNLSRPSPEVTCIVDTEEEFDWSTPLASANAAVNRLRAQAPAKAIFQHLDLVPTRAERLREVAVIQILPEFADTGFCETGTPQWRRFTTWWSRTNRGCCARIAVAQLNTENSRRGNCTTLAVPFSGPGFVGWGNGSGAGRVPLGPARNDYWPSRVLTLV